MDLSDSSKYSGGTLAQYFLIISNISVNDNGNYTCVATNNVGTTNSSAIMVTVSSSPQVTISSNDTSVVEGTSQFVIPCSVNASPKENNVFWTKGGSTLPLLPSKYSGGNLSTPSLTIYNTDRSDAGSYVCVANNSVGSASSALVTLNVLYAPYLTVYNVTYQSPVASTIQLICNVTANPGISTFYWLKNNLMLINATKYSGGTLNDRTLTIINSSIDDSGNYFCVAGNSVGNRTSTPITVIVTSLPIVTVTPNPATVTAGTSQFVLNCSVIASPPVSSVSWTKDGQAINATAQPAKYSGSSLDNFSLTIKSVERSDAGTYICVATNDIGSAQSASLALNVQYIPAVTVSNTTVIVSAGHNLTLNCSVVANPAISSLYWTKSGITVSSAANTDKYSGGNVNSPSLTIVNATVGDAGDYYCNANNSIGSNSSRAVTVFVSDVPVLDVSQTSLTLVQGTPSVTVYCSAGGYPSVSTVYWEKDGATLNVSSQPTKFAGASLTSQSLTIFNVSREDAGVYICVAQNSIGAKRSLPVTVTVDYPPYLTVGSDSVTQLMGASVTLMCLVSANPAITSFQWMKDGMNLTNPQSGKYSGGTLLNTNLTIDSLDPGTDSGSYLCAAANNVNRTVSTPVKLIITKLPIIDANQTQVNATVNQGVTLRCPAVTLDSLKDLYWTRNGIKINTSNTAKYEGGNATTPSLTIKYLAIEDSGLYLCHATNQYGTTTGGNSTITLQYAPILTVSNTTITNNAGETIVLTCTVDSNPAITNFYWLKSDSTVINSTVNPSKYSGGTVANQTLVIMNASSSDISNYTCVAANSIGTGRSNPVSVNVITVPVIITTPDITAVNNATVTLACPVTPLNSLTDLYWTKDGQRLSTTNNLKYSGGNTTVPSLTITSTSPLDSGSYVCVATNKFGNSSGGNITLNITYKPLLTVSNTTITNNAGETITLTCAVTSNPAMTNFYWLKSDSTVINSTVNVTKYSGGTITNTTLIIMNASSSDIANYTCVAVNSAGDSKSNPVAVNIITTPVIATTAPNVTAVSNSTVTLACPVTPLNSLTDLYWMKDGQRLSTSSTLKYSGGNTTVPSLTITSTSPLDSGSYVCVATNQFGNSSGGNTTLNITYLPQLAVSSTTITNNAGETIVLTCTVNSNPAITNFYWLKSDTTVIISNSNPSKYSGGTVTNTSLFILNASSSDIANYSCVANNSMGSSKSNPVAVNVITVPVISPNAPNMTAVSNSTVTLSCPVTPLNSLTDLYWTKDGQRLSTTSTLKYSGGNTTVPSLTITSTSPLDSGSYVCVATNQFGNSSGGNNTLNITYLPQLTVSNTTITNNAGETIVLTCTVNSNPAITNFYWLKSQTNVVNSTTDPVKYSGGSLTNTTLIIMNASSSDVANYTCVAENSLGISKSNTVSVNVITLPVITIPTANINSTRDSNITLACIVSQLESLTDLYWTKDDHRLNTSNISKYGGGDKNVPSLTINSLSLLDAGSYKCVATNLLGATSGGTISLNIQYPPVITTDSSNVTATSGATVNLTCAVSANPPVINVYWTKNSVRIFPSLNQTKYSGGTLPVANLTIFNVDPSLDSGLYICVAENIIGATNSQIYNVTIASLLVISQPNRTNIPSQENTTVTLECSVTPLDSLTELYWTKNGIRLSTVGSNKYSGGTKAIPNLTVNSLIDSDVGTYKCIAVNNFGTTGGSNITIDFQYKPRINISSTPVSITAGAPIRLFCNVSANPDISIFYWSKSGSGVVNPGNNSSKYGGGTITNTSLFIYLTDSYDSGNYTCSAGNSVGNTTSAAVALVVISKPLVTVSPTALTVPEGQAVVRFNCSVQAVPAVTAVGWIKDGKVLNMASQPAHYSGGTLAAPDLSILNVTKADAGIYACNASNDIGVGTSLNIRLDVTYSPTFNSSSGSSQGSVGQNITLSCDFAAYPPITQLYWLKDGNKLNLTLNPTKYSGGTVSVPSLTIINLNIATDPGSYQCVTNNSIGSNQGPSVNVTVVFDPYITVVNKTLTVTEGSNFTIDVAVHMYPPFSSITWYKDNNQVPVGDQTKYQNGTVSSPPLTVLSAAPQDTGTYRIVAHNSNSTVNETIAVDVLYSPKISTSPLTFNVTINSSKTIPCDVQAKPAVSSISWQKLDLDSGQISSVTIGGRFSGGNTSDPSLTVTGILSSDAAVYQCSAFNALGNMSGPNMTLRVFYKPEVSVSVFPSQITLDNKFELNCSAKGYPDVTSYMWFNGTTVVSRSNYFVKNNATSYDYIQFRCSVSNSMGTTNAYITPNILFKPVQLDNGQETILATKPSSVTLECKVIANPAPTSYRWFNGTYEIAGATNYSLTILIDSDDDFTVYSCAATNTFGELNPARDFDIQQDVPKTGSSTGSSGLSTATIILIVIIAIILLIILILIVVFCCLQGLCQKCVKRKNVKVEPSNIKETSAAPSAASISNLLLSSKPVAPVAAGNPGLIISLPEKAGPKPFYLPPLDPQAEAATEKFYRERKRRSRRKKKAKSSKEEEKNLTENGSDEGKTSPPSMTGLSDVTMGNTSTA